MSEPNRSSDRRAVFRWLLGVVLVVCLATSAAAQSSGRLLDGPRAAGTVGERFDGFAVARGAPTPDLTALINQVNADRQAVYAQRAQSENAPVAAIGKIYAAEIMKSAPAGTWFLADNGQWSQK